MTAVQAHAEHHVAFREQANQFLRMMTLPVHDTAVAKGRRQTVHDADRELGIVNVVGNALAPLGRYAAPFGSTVHGQYGISTSARR